jgi:predicted metal-dependent TIM-barrel fold hydrolase
MFFDALLHAAALRAADAEALRFFGVAGALVVSGDAFHPASAAALQAHWLATIAAARALGRRGLPAWAALGVDPRRLPRRGLAERLASLPELLGRPEVAALGPAGLELGGPQEEEVLMAQARLAAELRLPLLVRTGVRARSRQLGRVLELVAEAEVAPERVLVLGADARTLPVIRGRGHRALLALSGPRGVEEAARLVARHGAEGIVLGSDAGDGGGDLLAVPRAADRLQRAGLSVAVIRRVCLLNALAWLGREAADLAA